MVCAYSAVASGSGEPVKACKWKSKNHLKYSNTGFSTGCIQLKHVSGAKVGFQTYTAGGSSRAPVGTMHFEVMEAGRSKKADFVGNMEVGYCVKHTSAQYNEWKWVRCYNIFDRGTNRKTDGGCGCDRFRCLPGIQLNEDAISRK